MKKLLFFAGTAALVASCTNQEFESLSNNQLEKTDGITFEANMAGDANTRGEITEGEGNYPFFWYAEQDRINIWACGNVLGYNASPGGESPEGYYDEGTGVLASWNNTDITGAAAIYKATKSASKGQFTSINDENMLKFDANSSSNNKTKFVATYNAILKATSTGSDSKLATITLTLPAATNEQATSATAPNEAYFAPMYSVSEGYKDASYSSVGEKVNLNFIRPLALAKFKTLGIDEYYSQLFGKLEKITLTTKGYTSTSTTVNPTKIAYSSGSKEITINLNNTKDYSKYADGEANEVELTYAGGKEWSDSDIAFMTLLPVDRSEFREDNVYEDLKVVFEFENIALTKEGKKDGWYTSSDWTTLTKDGGENGVIPMPTLEIASYPFLVTENSENVALIVNTGNFKDVFNTTENLSSSTELNWASKDDGMKLLVSEINEIISEVELTDEELGYLKNFSGLKKLTLKKNTKLAASTFTNTQAANIEMLNLPEVTEIADNFAGHTFDKLEELRLPKYEFGSDAVINILLARGDDNANRTLKVLDMSGVDTMLPTFGRTGSLLLNTFAALEEVIVKDGVIVASNGFKGCRSLSTVTGKLDLSQAISAFEMQSGGYENAVLESIEVTGTTIPARAFVNCTNLESIKVDGKDIVPTTIGESAFEGATSLVRMDLSKATEIGAGAFKGCTSFNNDNKVLTVGTETVEANVFDGTALVMVHFTDAISIDKGIFNGVTTLKQVKFGKAFEVAKTNGGIGYWSNTFSTATNVDLFVANGQKYLSGTTLQLPRNNGTDNITFKTVQIQ